MRGLISNFCFGLLTFPLLTLATFSTGCQTSPVIHEIFSSDDFSSEAQEDTSDSELTDWSYDTDDGWGGPDEECYSRDVDGRRTVWCDTPLIAALECDDFESGCCCRNSCLPSLCQARDGGSAPCNYFDLVDPFGYCSLPADIVPVNYTCNGQCTPRSQCNNYDETGFCVDDSAAKDGLCLIYDLEQSLQMFCQQTCEMGFCDEAHMCVPLYDKSGNYSKNGACLPLR